MSTDKSEREAFEAWADDQGFVLTRTVHGDDYQDLRAQGPWEAWKARALQPSQPATVVQPVADLMRFYGVDSTDALISAQAQHVEKLQSKLQPAPSFAPQRVREG